MSEEKIKAIEQRLKKLELAVETLVVMVDVLESENSAKRAPKALSADHPLAPSKRGTPEYGDLLRKLQLTKPGEKGYDEAQKTLRAAGII